MTQHLSASSQSESSAEIEPLDFPVPFDDTDRTPPVDIAEVPHTALPAAQTLDAADSTPERKSLAHVPFSTKEIQLAIMLREQKKTLHEIGAVLGRSHEGVRKILEEWTPTADLAKATLRRGAVVLADRVIAQADVTQALEVLDRLDVLPKRNTSSDNKVQVVIGLNLDTVSPVTVNE